MINLACIMVWNNRCCGVFLLVEQQQSTSEANAPFDSIQKAIYDIQK